MAIKFYAQPRGSGPAGVSCPRILRMAASFSPRPYTFNYKQSNQFVFMFLFPPHHPAGNCPDRATSLSQQGPRTE